jgi:hypothetical protein
MTTIRESTYQPLRGSAENTRARSVVSVIFTA